VSSWQDKQRHDLSRGISEQQQVMKTYAKAYGYEWHDSSTAEDMHLKFDGVLSKGESSKKVQYKGLIRRIPEGTVLFEHTSVNGKTGWGRGESDLIFQKMPDHCLFIYDRQKALNTAYWEVGAYALMADNILRSNAPKKPAMTWMGREGRDDVYCCLPVKLLQKECNGMFAKV
jgi:hypothetical protein